MKEGTKNKWEGGVRGEEEGKKGRRYEEEGKKGKDV